MTFQQTQALASVFVEIAKLVRGCTNPRKCWDKALELAQVDTTELLELKIEDDLKEVGTQVIRVFEVEPPPSDLKYFYFGIYDSHPVGRHGSSTSLYVAGGDSDDPERQILDGRLPYFPQQRVLRSESLLTIRQVASLAPDQRRIHEYSVTFAAASIIAKFAILQTKLYKATYVGFDSGDFARVS